MFLQSLSSNSVWHRVYLNYYHSHLQWGIGPLSELIVNSGSSDLGSYVSCYSYIEAD